MNELENYRIKMAREAIKFVKDILMLNPDDGVLINSLNHATHCLEPLGVS